MNRKTESWIKLERLTERVMFQGDFGEQMFMVRVKQIFCLFVCLFIYEGGI